MNYTEFSERYNLMTQMDSSVPSSEMRASNWKIKTAELDSDHMEEGVSNGPDVTLAVIAGLWFLAYLVEVKLEIIS